MKSIKEFDPIEDRIDDWIDECREVINKHNPRVRKNKKFNKRDLLLLPIKNYDKVKS